MDDMLDLGFKVDSLENIKDIDPIGLQPEDNVCGKSEVQGTFGSELKEEPTSALNGKEGKVTVEMMHCYMMKTN